MVPLQVPMICNLISCINSKALLYSFIFNPKEANVDIGMQQPEEGAQGNNGLRSVYIQ